VKTTLRNELRLLRSQLSSKTFADVAQQTKLIVPKLINKRPGAVAIYWPLAGEVNLLSLAEKNIELALPRAEVGGLQFFSWSSSTPLTKDSCGISAPTGENPLSAKQVALMLVPALGIDQQGIRLGSGGGWYDRLRAAACWREVPALVVLPHACIKAELPSEPWDIPFAGWISELGLHWLEI
jgi:5-formyltetrahydrofolate cyclo-ligase